MSEDDIMIASTQYALPCAILGEDVEDFSFCPASSIEGLWREFRFPEGFAPRSVRFGDAFDPVHYQDAFSEFMEANEKDIKKAIEEEMERKKAERERKEAEREASKMPPASAKVSVA